MASSQTTPRSRSCARAAAPWAPARAQPTPQPPPSGAAASAQRRRGRRRYAGGASMDGLICRRGAPAVRGCCACIAHGLAAHARVQARRRARLPEGAGLSAGARSHGGSLAERLRATASHSGHAGRERLRPGGAGARLHVVHLVEDDPRDLAQDLRPPASRGARSRSVTPPPLRLAAAPGRRAPVRGGYRGGEPQLPYANFWQVTGCVSPCTRPA